MTEQLNGGRQQTRPQRRGTVFGWILVGGCVCLAFLTVLVTAGALIVLSNPVTVQRIRASLPFLEPVLPVTARPAAVPVYTPRPTRRPTPRPTPRSNKTLTTGKTYKDWNTGCTILISGMRGEWDLNFILKGDRRREIVADVFLPRTEARERVRGQLHKTFIDTGELYIHQYYSWGSRRWPDGDFRIRIRLDGKISTFTWSTPRRMGGDFNIFVDCG